MGGQGWSFTSKGGKHGRVGQGRLGGFDILEGVFEASTEMHSLNIHGLPYGVAQRESAKAFSKICKPKKAM